MAAGYAIFWMGVVVVGVTDLRNPHTAESTLLSPASGRIDQCDSRQDLKASMPAGLKASIQDKIRRQRGKKTSKTA